MCPSLTGLCITRRTHNDAMIFGLFSKLLPESSERIYSSVSRDSGSRLAEYLKPEKGLLNMTIDKLRYLVGNQIEDSVTMSTDDKDITETNVNLRINKKLNIVEVKSAFTLAKGVKINE